jgi:RNA polymerase sigma-70 factor, ECF subfamily
VTDANLRMATFAEVYRAHVVRVYAYCLSQVRNPADAEEIAAEVFASAFAAYDRVRPNSDGVQAWLIRIAHNAVIDHLRRTRRHSVVGLFSAGGFHELASDVDVERETLAREELRFVVARMRRLKQRDRLMVGLRVAADLSYAEIGALLDISEHAATMGVHRALQRLRRLCGEK